VGIVCFRFVRILISGIFCEARFEFLDKHLLGESFFLEWECPGGRAPSSHTTG
jgi:hypothetical protein